MAAAKVDLVNQIKTMQREDEAAKEQWWAYCAKEGTGKRDPTRHDEAFLQAFLDEYNSGALFTEAAPTATGGLVFPSKAPGGDGLSDFIKESQRKSAPFATAWKQYCMKEGNGVNDPAKHDLNFHVSFLDHLGARAGFGGGGTSDGGGQGMKRMMDVMGGDMGGGMGGMGKGMMGGGMGGGMAGMMGGGMAGAMGGGGGGGSGMARMMSIMGGGDDAWEMPAAKKAKMTGSIEARMAGVKAATGGMPPSGMGAVMAAVARGEDLGGPPQQCGSEKVQLVARIKSYQRASPDCKAAWWTFCDSKGQREGAQTSIRDPARHDAATLQEFCDGHGVP